MDKSFFKYIQPTIVKLSDDESLPEHLREHYLVNVNIVGISYFVENFLLIHDDEGGYMYMLTDDNHKIRISDNGWGDVIDIPRAYLVLTDDFVKSQEKFSSWMLSAIADNSYFLTGIDGFRPGVDYYLNDVLIKYLQENEPDLFDELPVGLRVTLPDYLSDEFTITKYWVEISKEEALHGNFKYFKLKNKIHDLEYSEEELDALCHTFFEVIKNGAIVSEEDMLKQYNQIYEKVIDYYNNYQTDCALANIALILNSTINTKDTGVTNCGCSNNSGSGSSDTNSNVSCYDAYKEAMATWLSTMLGDVNFYKDWMWLTDIEGKFYPNEGLIESLILLLENFEDAEYDLSFSGKSIYNHTCEYNNGSLEDKTNHTTIKNYIQLLRWVLEGCIDNNANKIKVIGEKFGKLLPRLCF